jgi:hypothetical protein
MNTYRECYEKALKPMFDDEANKPESQKDPELAETMLFVDKFFNQGGYDFLTDLENTYECASLCETPLFYLTKDVRLGKPQIDCVTATVDAMTDN